MLVAEGLEHGEHVGLGEGQTTVAAEGSVVGVEGAAVGADGLQRQHTALEHRGGLFEVFVDSEWRMGYFLTLGWLQLTNLCVLRKKV